MLPARTISIAIDAAPDAIYRFVADAFNLTRWASGFCQTVAADPATEGSWRITTPDGAAARVRFAPANALGILDHWVTLGEGAEGREAYVPMRVVANEAGSEVLFTIFQLPDMSDAQLEKDTASVTSDLGRLKALLEARTADTAAAAGA